MYFLYSLITAVGTILLAPYVLLSRVRRKKYLPNLSERVGLKFPPELATHGGTSRAIWLHAVSVGEVLAAIPFARCLKQRFPGWRLVISTTTATGQALAHERMNFADAVFYFPFDWNGPVRRALWAVRPGVIVILETEIWPNLLRRARRTGVPVIFVNGRLSDRSFRGFSRAVKMSGGVIGGFLRRILNDATLYLVQTQQDAARLIALGAATDRVIVTGSMKYDMVAPGPNAFVNWLQAELKQSQRGPVVVAGSVISGEEKPVLEAFATLQRKWPQALLILAPRKPERFATAAEVVSGAGWHPIRRSAISLDGSSAGILGSAAHEDKSILLLDTIGELAAIYSLADAVFIGGSLEPAGGHNPLEPAGFAKVPVFGRSMDNFREIGATLLEAGAAIQVDSAAQLGIAWAGLLENAERRAQMGLAAREIVERNRGATAATLDRLAAIIEPQRAHT
ncbi:MAG: 3-deoxy-D-manno-octulosonic acid transferase [Acidobacteria bacterium]|nr:MAG: 3-deoxy-D-manno-octulosonic acid transferase [Acidobacteriota bacterium]